MASPTVSTIATATITNYLEVRSPYDYVPGLAPGLAFTVVFGILTIAHIVVALKFRYWVALIALIPGGLLEVLGWAGRLWSHYTVLNSNPFIMQICCLILGPAFFSAWAYTVLGYCIVSLGPSFSLLKAKAYLAIFVTADAVCLILQAVGGGMAAVAAKKGTGTKGPTNIMLAGVLVQLGTMTAFSILAIDFITRVIVRKPYAFRVRSLERQGLWTGVETSPSSGTITPPTPGVGEDVEKTLQPVAQVSEVDRARRLRKGKLLLIGTAFASAMIYARGVYRSIELAQGWTGNLMTHEVYFVWLDGFPMVLCLAMFLALHPGWLIESQ